jgi:hypothetical protein
MYGLRRATSKSKNEGGGRQVKAIQGLLASLQPTLLPQTVVRISEGHERNGGADLESSQSYIRQISPS